MNQKTIAILGSTGSIGTQTLEVVRKLNFSVSALATNQNIRLLETQIREFKPKLAVVYNRSKAAELRLTVSDLPVKVLVGTEGLCEAAIDIDTDIVLNSVVGMIGLIPTLAAIEAKKDIALANKETLVAGGSVVMEAARKNKVKILPVDSEHSAIFQCLQGSPAKGAVNRLILTASGGPFFGFSLEDLAIVTPEQALKHPNWNMGMKITIDSASMMNKGLELIEASWLFDMPADKIDIVIHRESIIHSLIEYIDCSLIAQLSLPDMRIPIQYALTFPERVSFSVQQLSLAKIGTMSFYEVDEETFACLATCREALQRGGLAPAAANAANEEAVNLFLDRKISFTDIAVLVAEAMENQKDVTNYSIQDILEADKEARAFVLSVVSK